MVRLQNLNDNSVKIAQNMPMMFAQGFILPYINYLWIFYFCR